MFLLEQTLTVSINKSNSGLNRFDEQPEDRTVLENEIVQFPCLNYASNKLKSRLTWLKDGVILNAGIIRNYYLIY